MIPEVILYSLIKPSCKKCWSFSDMPLSSLHGSLIIFLVPSSFGMKRTFWFSLSFSRSFLLKTSFTSFFQVLRFPLDLLTLIDLYLHYYSAKSLFSLVCCVQPNFSGSFWNAPYTSSFTSPGLITSLPRNISPYAQTILAQAIAHKFHF